MTGPVAALAAAVRVFGQGAAAEKLRLLDEVAASLPSHARELAALRSALDFLRAYPDDAAVLRRARALAADLPPAPPRFHTYSWNVVRRLVRMLPGKVEIAWDDLDEETSLCDTLDLVVTPGESQGVLDPDLPFEEWFRRCRPSRFATDLEFLVSRIEGSGLPAGVQAFLYDQCRLTLRYDGPASCQVELPGARLRPQRRPFERERFPLEPVIRTPLPAPVRGGEELIDVALRALCARELEIYPLIFGTPDDARVVECGHGLRLVLIGLEREFRSPLETIAFFLVVKNGAPIAYGPAGVLFGCCEMGINLFPEFRGAEIRTVYAQVMRVLHQAYGVELFFLTRYGMGEGNPEAIASGAFWFYRKLGFRATSPAVEALAREEEARMAADPSHRSDRAMLRRLSHTEAWFDLSGGRRRPFPIGPLGVAESRFIGHAFGGDPEAARERCGARVAKVLGLPHDAGWGLDALAPTLAMIPGLGSWTRSEKAALAAIVRAKGAPAEADSARLLGAHARLESALRVLAGEPPVSPGGTRPS